MGKSSPPPAPNYQQAAIDQGAANIDAARVGSKMNNPNVYTPFGSQTVNWNGDQPTIHQTLSPAQQGLLNQSQQTQGLLGGLGEQGARSLQGVVGTGVDYSGLPGAPGSADQTRTNVINAMMGRTNEDYGKQIDQTNSDLVAAGIRPGSKAYDDRMQMIERSRNDARQQAEIAGGNAAAQAFGMDTQRRKDAMGEYLSQRQTPLNEINALLSGSQVSNPFATPGYAQNAQVAPAPLYAATDAAGQYGTQVYNAQQAQQGNLTSGLFGLGAASIMGGLPALGTMAAAQAAAGQKGRGY